MLEALVLLIRVGVCYAVYAFFKNFSSEHNESAFKAYRTPIVGAAVLALVSWHNHGTHIEDMDPVHGGGEVVVDFVPTREERNQHGLFVFTVVAVLGTVGVYQGRNG